MRADARRNRDLLLSAAAQVYAERGVDASLEEIARRADVGIGTLYRHFPTRDALNEAVYRREVERLCDGVDELIASNPPDVALAGWMRRFAGYVATKKGMAGRSARRRHALRGTCALNGYTSRSRPGMPAARSRSATVPNWTSAMRIIVRRAQSSSIGSPGSASATRNPT